MNILELIDKHPILAFFMIPVFLAFFFGLLFYIVETITRDTK